MSTQKSTDETPQGDALLQAKMRATFLTMLQENVMEITFTKTDGTERVMVCSLHPSLLPAVEVSTDPTAPKKERKINLSVIACFDLEANGWRSFRLDSIKDFEFSLKQNKKWGLI